MANPTNQHCDNLTFVLQNEREIRRFISTIIKTEDPDSERFNQAFEAMRLLNENTNLLTDLLSPVTCSLSPVACHLSPVAYSQSPVATRGRAKQSYLLNPTNRPAFIAQLQSYFTNHYNPQTRRFRLPDGTTINAHTFLACVYDIGIRDGLAADDAPVNDFADMAKEAALAAGMDLRTAYNTIQSVTRTWRSFVGNRGYIDRTIHLHSLREDQISPNKLPDYQLSLSLLHQVSLLVN